MPADYNHLSSLRLPNAQQALIPKPDSNHARKQGSVVKEGSSGTDWMVGGAGCRHVEIASLTFALAAKLFTQPTSIKCFLGVRVALERARENWSASETWP